MGWRREIRDSEQQGVSEFFGFLKHFNLSEGGLDRWIWKKGKGGEYSVNSVYLELSKFGGGSRIDDLLRVSLHKVWKTIAPVKAQVMAWRLLRNRLPTIDNLRKRSQLDGANGLCCWCESVEESANHLFLECAEVANLWYKLVAWIGTTWAAPRSITHLYGSTFSGLLGDGLFKKRLGGLWVCVVWVLWKWRNTARFELQEWNFRKIEEEVKCRFWSWCVAKEGVY